MGEQCDGQSANWPLVLRTGWNVPRRQRRALAEEIIFHLLQQKFLRFLGTQVQPVLVHDHLHLFQPHLPRLFGDVFVDSLAQGVVIEGSLVQARHFFLELDAENLPAGLVGFLNWRTGHAATATHNIRIRENQYRRF